MSAKPDSCLDCDGSGYACAPQGGSIDADCPTCKGYGSQAARFAAEREVWRQPTTSPSPLDDLIARILDGQLVVREIPVGHTTPGGAIIAYDYQVTFDPSLSRNYQATVEAEQVADNNDDPRPY